MWKIIVGFLALIVAFAVLHGIVGASQNFGLPDFIADCMCNKKGFLPAFCEFFNGFLVKDEGDFLNVLGIVGIVLLTVMIPVAVVIFDNKGKKGEYEFLDRNVKLEHVIKARFLLRYLGFIYVPIFFWVGFSSPVILQVVYLFFWGWGVLGILGILRNTYHWMKKGQFDLRYEYLENLSNPKEMSENWSSVWKVENIDGHNEKQFFTIFSSTIDELLRGGIENIKIVMDLVGGFNSFIDKRSSFVLVVLKENFSKILEWHFFIWEKINQPRNEKDNDISGFHYVVFNFLSSILKKIEEKELKENISYFFAAFKPHVEKYKERSVEIGQDRKKYYVEKIIPDFFDALVKNIENCENYGDSENIWWNFPSEWKITSEKMKNPNNHIPRALYNKFIYWARSRILSSTEHDKTLDDVAYNLFPLGCPIMWSRILTFLVHFRRSGNQMKSLIENLPNFGDMGRATAGWMGNDEEVEKKAMEEMRREEEVQKEETISLALILFRGDFTQDNLKKYIAELKALESTHDNERVIKSVKIVYTDIFKKLLKARCKMDEGK